MYICVRRERECASEQEERGGVQDLSELCVCMRAAYVAFGTEQEPSKNVDRIMQIYRIPHAHST